MGPWRLGRLYRPLAALSVAGGLGLVVIGVQPPNERALLVVGGLAGVLLLAWFGGERRRFPGPPLPASLRTVIRPEPSSIPVGEAADG